MGMILASWHLEPASVSFSEIPRLFPTLLAVSMLNRLLTVSLTVSAAAFSPQLSQNRQRHRHDHQIRFAYGRGAEIWPPTNDDAVRLADSFPNNQLPPQVEAMLRQANEIEAVSSPSPASWKRPLSMILRRAAARAQSETVADGTSSASSKSSVSLDKTPVVLALCLTVFIKPLDALLAMFISGYLTLLYQISRQPRSMDNDIPTLPALPPQGHVPYLLNNPLGFSLAYSTWYDRWLRAGVVLGLVAPLAVTLQYTLTNQVAAASLVARPLFFLCLQAVLEASLAGKVVMAPLPLRILASVMVNTVRLGYLWQWSTTTIVSLGAPGRLLAVANMMYWTANLFGFLIPVGVMR